MSAFKYQWNQTIDVGTAGLLSKQWTSIRHILSLLVTANACVHVTAYVAVRRSLSTTYTAVVLGLLLRQYVSYQFGVWAARLGQFITGLLTREGWRNTWSGNDIQFCTLCNICTLSNFNYDFEYYKSIGLWLFWYNADHAACQSVA